MAEIISIICICILVMVVIVIICSILECKKLTIKAYDVCSERLPASFDGYKIMVLADLHNMINDGRDETIINYIKENKPDIIVLAGDMIVCTREAEDDNMRTAAFLSRLSELAHCYYGYGNHEKGLEEAVHGVPVDSFARYKDKLSDCSGIRLLDNETIEIKKGKDAIKLSGLNIDIDYYKRLIPTKLNKAYIDDKLGSKAPEDYIILIAHNPDYYKTYARWGADLVFSGHNHGGLVRFPLAGGIISPKLHIFPRYDYGKYEDGNTTMLVSGGMGAHSIKIRVNNVPELLLVTLRRKSE